MGKWTMVFTVAYDSEIKLTVMRGRVLGFLSLNSREVRCILGGGFIFSLPSHDSFTATIPSKLHVLFGLNTLGMSETEGGNETRRTELQKQKNNDSLIVTEEQYPTIISPNK
uniref:Uncharacterized protein n=1 Tax=Trieres chinensis TaxID=1514140 RepID=A0A7S2ABE1_TRICV|mmetsp:Transcript_9997/g.21127  ORF Transcript_9997/g.21127 Transcript_9997/m.21127 type:complete len:112 (+) Transcript_9997:145-480(+)